MSKVLFDSFNAFIRVGVDGVSFSVNECTELDNELLKPEEIEFLGFSFVKEFNIKISDKGLNLILGS